MQIKQKIRYEYSHPIIIISIPVRVDWNVGCFVVGDIVAIASTVEAASLTSATIKLKMRNKKKENKLMNQ